MQSGKRYSASEGNLLERVMQEMQVLSLSEDDKDEGYTLTRVNGKSMGKRIYRKSATAWVGPRPSLDCEVFVCGIPPDCFENELIPVLKKAGDLFEFRLDINFSFKTRGFAFALYTSNAEAMRAIRFLNNFMIRPSWKLVVCLSPNISRAPVAAEPPCDKDIETSLAEDKLCPKIVKIMSKL